MKHCITFEDICAAQKRIDPYIYRTPVVTSESLNAFCRAQVYFKCENLQTCHAFKSRGACNAVFSLSEESAAAGVVAHSSGNHAAALARAAQLRGIAAHIVMPHNSVATKIAAVRSFGVEPIFCEPTAEARQATAEHVMAETGATFIHPFNNPQVIAGQGTAAKELLEQVPDLDCLIVPVGGGGLMSGSLIAGQHLSSTLKVYGAEPAWADDAYRSIKAGAMQPAERYDTIADGLRTPLGTLTFPIILDLVTEILLAEERHIQAATTTMLQVTKLVVEPSGAVPLAALLAAGEKFYGQRVGVIISGGMLDDWSLATNDSAIHSFDEK